MRDRERKRVLEINHMRKANVGLDGGHIWCLIPPF